MSECYFTVEVAKDYMTGNPHISTEYIDIFVDLLNACREIIRLNEVIEGMKEKPTVDIFDRDNRLDWVSVGYCERCGAELVEFYPGRLKCPECE